MGTIAAHTGQINMPKLDVRNVWAWLNAAEALTPAEKDRQKALLELILLVIIPMALVLAVIVLPFMMNPSALWQAPIFPLMSFCTSLYVVAYLLNRSNYYSAAAAVFTATMAAGPILAVTIDPSQADTLLPVIGASLSSILLSNLLFRRRIITVLTAIGNVLLLLFLVAQIPQSNLNVLLLMTPVLAIATIVLVYDSHRVTLEQMRRKTVVDALQAAERLAAIVEGTSDLVGSAYPDGRAFYLNKAGWQMVGRDPDTDLSASSLLISDFSPVWATEIIEKVGIPAALRDGTWSGEAAVLTADGKEIPVSQTIIAHRNPDGAVSYVSSIARDISEQKQTAAKLRHSEERYRLLADNMPNSANVLFSKDLRYEVVAGPEVKTMGYDPDAMLGRTPLEAMGEEVAAAFEPTFQAVLSGQRLEFEMPFGNQSYNSVWVPIRDEQSDVRNILLVLNNITARKQAEEVREKLIKDLQAAKRLAEENSRLKSEFLSTMSHELRTPLNAIEGFTGVVLKRIGGAQFNEKTEEYLMRVHSNSRRLLQLINDFLDLSRVEAGRLELANQPFTPARLARRWCDEISVLAERKGIEFEVVMDPDLPETLYGDEEAISKVAINLLGNAIKFTERGSVTLKLDSRDSVWEIAVSDTGIGIPPHAREFIFEEFRQVDQTSKRKYGGTGLGLAIVQKYARSMGGNVTVKSETGQGSTFTVTLPLKTTA